MYHLLSSRTFLLLWKFNVCFLRSLPSQYFHTTPTQLEMFFQQGPAAASFHFECLPCYLGVLDVGWRQDQQMVRGRYSSPCHVWYGTVCSLDIRKPLHHQTMSYEELCYYNVAHHTLFFMQSRVWAVMIILLIQVEDTMSLGLFKVLRWCSN